MEKRREERLKSLSTLELDFAALPDEEQRAKALAAVALLRSLTYELTFADEKAVGRKEQLFSVLEKSRINGRITAQSLKEQLQLLEVEKLKPPLLSHLQTIFSGIVGWELGQQLAHINPETVSKLRRLETYRPPQFSREQYDIIYETIADHPEIQSWLQSFVTDVDLSARLVSRSHYLKALHSIIVEDDDAVEQLDLTARVFNVLRRSGVVSVSGVRAMLLVAPGNFRGFGAGAKEEIIAALKKFEQETSKANSEEE